MQPHGESETAQSTKECALLGLGQQKKKEKVKITFHGSSVVTVQIAGTLGRKRTLLH